MPIRHIRFSLIASLTLVIAGCGIETATTAATAGAAKAEEARQGKETMQQMEKKIDQANQQAEQRLKDIDSTANK